MNNIIKGLVSFWMALKKALSAAVKPREDDQHAYPSTDEEDYFV